MVLTAPRDARSPDGAPAHGATLSMKGDPGGNLADEHGFSAVASKSPVVDDAWWKGSNLVRTLEAWPLIQETLIPSKWTGLGQNVVRTTPSRDIRQLKF